MDPSSQPDSSLTGPIVLQGFLQYLMQGVIITQGNKFWHRSGDDSIFLRTYVYSLLLFSILQTALETYKVWYDAVIRRHWYNSPLHCTEFLLNGVICTFVEAYLVRRCWRMTQNNLWVLAFLTALLTSSCVANIYLAVAIQNKVNAATGNIDPLKASTWAFPLWVYDSLVLAILNTVIISFFLWRSKTGMNHLDKTVRHIINITWESAALPCVCMILAAGLYSGRNATVISKVQHLDLFFIVATGKVYTFGLLRTLNSRTSLRKRLHSGDIGRTTLSGYKWGEGSENTQTSGSVSSSDPQGKRESNSLASSTTMAEVNSAPSAPTSEEPVAPQNMV